MGTPWNMQNVINGVIYLNQNHVVQQVNHAWKSLGNFPSNVDHRWNDFPHIPKVQGMQVRRDGPRVFRQCGFVRLVGTASQLQTWLLIRNEFPFEGKAELLLWLENGLRNQIWNPGALVATAVLFLLGHQCFAAAGNSAGLGAQPWGHVQQRPDVHRPSQSSESTCEDRLRRGALTFHRRATLGKLFNFSELQPPLPRSGGAYNTLWGHRENEMKSPTFHIINRIFVWKITIARVK